MKALIPILGVLIVAGCMYAPGKVASQKCGDQDYDCNITAEAVLYLRQEKFYDCDGKLVKTEIAEHDGNEGMVKIPSVRNIPIEHGEFINMNNGTKAPNQKVADGGWPSQHYDRQYVKVSGIEKHESLRLEKGVNVIRYTYSSCEKDGPNGCEKWGVLEEGDRTVLALYSKVLSRTCTRKAKCNNGVVESYDKCTDIKPIPEQVLDVDFGRDFVK